MLTKVIGVRLIAVLLISGFLGTSSAMSQLAPANNAEKATCHKYGDDSICPALVFEFGKQDALNTGSPSAGLDQPWTFIDPFLDRVRAKAFADALSSEVIAKEAQVALQTVSTSAAVTQVGAAPTVGGSTNLVTKPTTTDFISMAAESGAFTDTSNGTTTTLHANALGLEKYLRGLAMFQKIDGTSADVLQHLALTVTLNVANQASSSLTPTAGAATTSTPTSLGSILIPSNNASLSSFGAAFTILRKYNPQTTDFQSKWKSGLNDNATLLDTTGKAIATAVDQLEPLVEAQCVSPGLWQPLQVAEQSKDFDTFVHDYSMIQGQVYDCILKIPNIGIVPLSAAQQAFSEARGAILDKARGTLATVSYAYTPSAQMPATHNFTASVAQTFKGFKSGKFAGAQLTGNFTGTIFASIPPGATYGRLKDVQGSGEFDLPLGGTKDSPLGTLSFAGYSQYQYSASVLNITSANEIPGTNIPLPANAQTYLGTAGWLEVVQGKFVFNLKKGLSIPVAVKWSNKTDLSQAGANDVRGQFGISYDFSALSSLIKGGS